MQINIDNKYSNEKENKNITNEDKNGDKKFNRDPNGY